MSCIFAYPCFGVRKRFFNYVYQKKEESLRNNKYCSCGKDKRQL